mgnify:CR=1 FL=1|jgi:hypothetical protein|tara:strand:+ start:610 stop:783 length:174 start_codon:yes stop_codon:yes gene_type:complete
MTTLNELTKIYENRFIRLCKNIEKKGMDEYIKDYNTLLEICEHLCIDTEEIEEQIIN